MGVEKRKQEVRRKVKVLTKRDKAHRRVARVHKAIELKRKVRGEKKKKAALHRRKLATFEENEVVEMPQPEFTQNNTSEM
jgi:hypothetical protein